MFSTNTNGRRVDVNLNVIGTQASPRKKAAIDIMIVLHQDIVHLRNLLLVLLNTLELCGGGGRGGNVPFPIS